MNIDKKFFLVKRFVEKKLFLFRIVKKTKKCHFMTLIVMYIC